MSRSRRVIRILALATIGMGSPTGPVVAETVVVVSAESPVNRLSHPQVVNIFLGRSSYFPGNSPAIPVDQREGSAVREEFYSKLVGWTPAQLKGHWSRIVFTGRGQPPKQLANNEEVKQLLATSPGTIGYIEKKSIDSRVKIVALSP